MTGPGDPFGELGRTPATGAAGTGPSDAEQLLSQALRARVGGTRAPTPPPSGNLAHDVPRRRLSAAQAVLLALLIGLVVGMGAGLATLLVR